MRPLALAAVLIAASACQPQGASEQAAPSSAARIQQQGLDNAPVLAPTRLLRRLHLTLRGKEPTVQDYAEAKAAAASNEFDALFDTHLEAALASEDFYAQMVAFGHDYLKVGDYKRGSGEGIIGGYWKGGQAPVLDPCPAGTVHAGAIGHFTGLPPQHGDPWSTCDDPNAESTTVEPWWAPGTTVTVIGRAGRSASSYNGRDCGRVYLGEMQAHFPDPSNSIGCGCGPNLTYCSNRRLYGPTQYPRQYDSSPYFADSPRRMLFEEPARLVAHVIANDKPFSDLVIGSYTVAPRRLQHMYVRWARMNPDNAALVDASNWWQTATDGWDEVELESLHPNLLSQRDYKFDPRTNPGSVQGVGAAGVLTQLGPNVWYPRERVRAARWLEIFACRNFTAPDPSVTFNAFDGDPYSSGTCQHCHTTIDPAAIHFKRLEVEDDTPRYGTGHINFGGVGVWEWRRTWAPSFADSQSPGGVFWYQPYGRWHVSFAPDTFLTPVNPSQLMTNEDTRFLDFLPPGSTLFGRESDGTIGPLGFGKLLVESGEFDRCAVQTLFARFMGRKLDLTKEAALETALVETFTQNGRQVKPLIRALVKSDEFRRGL